MVYSMTQDTPSYLCDRNDKLHPWAAVRLCQEVTEYHGNSTGIGYHELLARNRAWVIVRSYYEFHRRADAFENITLNTWSRGADGLFAFRDYRIVNPTGEVLLTGTSYWTLIDFSQRRAVRLGDAVEGYGFHDEFATDRHVLSKLRVPRMTEDDTVFQYIVRNSILDHTQHVNNSEYIKLLFDALAETTFDSTRPFSLELNFNHETRPGDTLRVQLCQSNGQYFGQILNSQGVSVSSCVSYLKV